MAITSPCTSNFFTAHIESSSQRVVTRCSAKVNTKAVLPPGAGVMLSSFTGKLRPFGYNFADKLADTLHVSKPETNNFATPVSLTRDDMFRHPQQNVYGGGSSRYSTGGDPRGAVPAARAGGPKQLELLHERKRRRVNQLGPQVNDGHWSPHEEQPAQLVPPWVVNRQNAVIAQYDQTDMHNLDGPPASFFPTAIDSEEFHLGVQASGENDDGDTGDAADDHIRYRQEGSSSTILFANDLPAVAHVTLEERHNFGLGMPGYTHVARKTRTGEIRTAPIVSPSSFRLGAPNLLSAGKSLAHTITALPKGERDRLFPATEETATVYLGLSPGDSGSEEAEAQSLDNASELSSEEDLDVISPTRNEGNGPKIYLVVAPEVGLPTHFGPKSVYGVKQDADPSRLQLDKTGALTELGRAERRARMESRAWLEQMGYRVGVWYEPNLVEPAILHPQRQSHQLPSQADYDQLVAGRPPLALSRVSPHALVYNQLSIDELATNSPAAAATARDRIAQQSIGSLPPGPGFLSDIDEPSSDLEPDSYSESEHYDPSAYFRAAYFGPNVNLPLDRLHHNCEHD
jgi:hypothetical protein